MNTPARGSVDRCFLNAADRCFLNLRKLRARPVVRRFLELRKLTKAVGPRFLKIKKMHESGWSVFLEMRPVQVNVLYGANTSAPALPPTCVLHVQGYLAHNVRGF